MRCAERRRAVNVHVYGEPLNLAPEPSAHLDLHPHGLAVRVVCPSHGGGTTAASQMHVNVTYAAVTDVHHEDRARGPASARTPQEDTTLHIRLARRRRPSDVPRHYPVGREAHRAGAGERRSDPTWHREGENRGDEPTPQVFTVRAGQSHESSGMVVAPARLGYSPELASQVGLQAQESRAAVPSRGWSAVGEPSRPATSASRRWHRPWRPARLRPNGPLEDVTLAPVHSRILVRRPTLAGGPELIDARLLPRVRPATIPRRGDLRQVNQQEHRSSLRFSTLEAGLRGNGIRRDFGLGENPLGRS